MGARGLAREHGRARARGQPKPASRPPPSRRKNVAYACRGCLAGCRPSFEIPGWRVPLGWGVSRPPLGGRNDFGVRMACRSSFRAISLDFSLCLHRSSINNQHTNTKRPVTCCTLHFFCGCLIENLIGMPWRRQFRFPMRNLTSGRLISVPAMDATPSVLRRRQWTQRPR